MAVSLKNKNVEAICEPKTPTVIRVVNYETQEPASFYEHAQTVRCFQLSPDNSLLVVGDQGNTLTAWDLIAKKKLKTYWLPDVPYLLAFNSTGSSVAFALENCDVGVAALNPPTEEARKLETENNLPERLWFEDQDTKLVADYGEDDTFEWIL